MTSITRLLVTGFLFIAMLYALGATVSQADTADKENCLMCHKYRFLGRIDEEGKRKNYNVTADIFLGSIHRNVPCRDCHNYIKRIPHDPVTEEVNCANECHINPPFTKEKFSHKKIIEAYNKSVHGIRPEDSLEAKKAKPYCKYCHLNPLYSKVEESRISYDETLARCKNCHLKKGVTMAYQHITHRLRHKTSRSPQEIVQLCSKNCHQDNEVMQKCNVSEKSMAAVETYRQSIHGKAVSLGSKKSADCISCHATNAIHDIHKKDDVKSTLHEGNLKKTCNQCHEYVNDIFVKIGVHPSITREEKPILYFASIGLTFALYGSVFGMVGLMFLEVYGRRKDGIRFRIKKGSSWKRLRKKDE